MCNGSELCNGAGTCTPGTPLDVDDNNACTADSCHPTQGAQHTPHPAGTPCPDGNVCNGDELCDGVGTCTPGTPLDVDDGNACTADSCHPTQGVQHTPHPAGTACADGDLCDGDEQCDGFGTCAPGTPPPIDDGDPCTLDTCDASTGIEHRGCSELDVTVATTLYEAAKFLFEGENPIQTGVAEGAIDPVRISVMRGRVFDTSSNPLSGVSIRLLALDPNEPSAGSTVSQANGEFDFAVNGGGLLDRRLREGGIPVGAAASASAAARLRDVARRRARRARSGREHHRSRTSRPSCKWRRAV